eukprot:scaffold19720_cov35-Cyclotella_meneghiniana.AAC.3
MSSQSPTPRKGNIRSQRPNRRTCPKYFTDKWLELYKKCYGCDESITQVPDPPSALPIGDFNHNFPAFAQAYDRLYNPNNPVFLAHYITNPDQITANENHLGKILERAVFFPRYMQDVVVVK